MRKSTMFISVVLTTFMLALMFGVVSAYQNMVEMTSSKVSAAPVSGQVAMPVEIPPTAVPVQPQFITAEQAATLASLAIGRTDVYSAETTQFNGVTAYLITFSSGDLVYVDLDGQILSLSKLQTVVVQGGNSGNNNRRQGNNSSGEHENEHEEEHEDGDD